MGAGRGDKEQCWSLGSWCGLENLENFTCLSKGHSNAVQETFEFVAAT